MKRIVLFILVIYTGITLYAQEAQFGLKAGLNIAEVTNNQSGNTNSRAGFNVGGLVHIHLDPSWAIQPELMYSTLAYSINFPIIKQPITEPNLGPPDTNVDLAIKII